MNRLNIERRTQIARCLAEGNSLRSTSRLTGAVYNTVLKFAVELGEACLDYQHKTLRNLTCAKIQCDEIWSFVGCKEKNVTEEKQAEGLGDAWTWVAIDADTRLVAYWLIGPRNAESAYEFMQGLHDRLRNRPQISTDGHKPYPPAVFAAFGEEVDYGVLTKIYGQIPGDKRERYIGAEHEAIIGQPDPNHIRTSYVERQNLSMRMGMRRFTRKTNAFSKKIYNHECAVAFYYMCYNFFRIHPAIGETPAQAAGIADHKWSLEEIAGLMDD